MFSYMSHHENDKVNDRVENKPNTGLDNVDRMALMQEKPQGQPDTGSYKLHDVPIQGLDKPDKLDKKEQPAERPAAESKENPAAESVPEGSDNDLTRGVKNKKAGGAKVEKKPSAGSEAGDTASGGGASVAPDTDKPHDPEIVKKTGDNPQAPTVAFVDVFQKDMTIGKTPVSHGEISRTAAEKNGFNTVAIDVDTSRDKFGNKDYAKDLNAIDKKIDNGELKLGKGDALNISMGNDDPTFKQASEFVGFPVTRENLAENREKILSRMNEIKNDPSRSEGDRDTASRVVETNKAIDKLQDRGIEVVHASGNEGNDKFSWEFMNAKTQLSSNKPDGKADNFSADHSLTTKGNGVIPIHSRNDIDPLSKTPVARQTGSYEVGDTGVKFQREKQAPFTGDTRVFNRENDSKDSLAPRIKPEAPQVTSAMFSPETALHGAKIPAAKQLGAEAQTERTPDKFSPSKGEFSMIWPAKVGKGASDAAPVREGETTSAHVLRGTSFSNIDYLKGNFDSMARRKNSW